MADYFETVTKEACPPKDVGNWLLGPVSAIVNSNNIDIADFAAKVPTGALAGLLTLEAKKAISTATAKQVLEEMFRTGKSAAEIVAEKGLAQISDSQAIEEAVAQAVESNPQAVKDFHAGKESALKFLVGQVMRATRGRANPQMVNDLLKKKLAGE